MVHHEGQGTAQQSRKEERRGVGGPQHILGAWRRILVIGETKLFGIQACPIEAALDVTYEELSSGFEFVNPGMVRELVRSASALSVGIAASGTEKRGEWEGKGEARGFCA